MNKPDVTIEREHGELSPVCEYCDRNLTPNTSVLRIPCSDGGEDHTACIFCIVEAIEKVKS